LLLGNKPILTGCKNNSTEPDTSGSALRSLIFYFLRLSFAHHPGID